MGKPKTCNPCCAGGGGGSSSSSSSRPSALSIGHGGSCDHCIDHVHPVQVQFSFPALTNSGCPLAKCQASAKSYTLTHNGGNVGTIPWRTSNHNAAGQWWAEMDCTGPQGYALSVVYTVAFAGECGVFISGARINYSFLPGVHGANCLSPMVFTRTSESRCTGAPATLTVTPI